MGAWLRGYSSIFLQVAARAKAALLLLLLCAGCGAPAIVRYAGPEALGQRGSGVILVGDTQRTSFAEFWREQNDPERIRILASAAREDPRALILLGDLVFQGDSRRQWSNFNEAASPIRMKGIPVFPLLGNHDHFGNSNEGRELFFAQFPHLRKSQWYSVTIEGVGYILLNSILEHLDDAQQRAQENWYRKTLAEMERDPAVDAIVVCCHYPPYTHSTLVQSDLRVRDSFAAPFLASRKGVFFFTGHCHSYEHFAIGGKHFIVSGGGGGPRQTVDPARDAENVPPDQFHGPAKRFFHYCRLTREGGGLLVEVKGFYSAGDSLAVMDRIVAPPAQAGE